MKRLFFVYISIFIFSLLLVVNGLQAEGIENEIALPTRTEQLSESDEIAYRHDTLSRGFRLGSDEGIATSHGRRFGLNKTPKTNVYSRQARSGKNIPIKLSFTKEERHFIQYLTTRHSQGFYIYSLKVLLL